MIGGENAHHAVGVARFEQTGRQTDRIGRVAHRRLADQVLGRQFGQLLLNQRQVPLGREHVDAARLESFGQPLISMTQQAPAREKTHQLLGPAAPTQRPQARSRPTGHDYRVSRHQVLPMLSAAPVCHVYRRLGRPR